MNIYCVYLSSDVPVFLRAPGLEFNIPDEQTP